MNNLEREQVQQSYAYRNDLHDVHSLASGYFDWLSTLVLQAQKAIKEDKAETAKTLLDIAQYLAEDQANEFLKQAKQFV